jgi:hypothetical protein
MLKKCTNCGVENPEASLFCMSCGVQFPKIVPEPSTQPSTYSSSPYGNSSPSTAYYGKPTSEIRPGIEQFSNLLNHPGYNRLITGSILFAVSPLILIGLGLIFPESEGIMLSLIVNIVELISFGFFIYGIYSVAQLEPRDISNQLKNVPILFIVYLGLTSLTTVAFEIIPTITENSSLVELRNFVIQSTVIFVLQMVAVFFLLYGSIKFTNWFEKFVTMLRAPFYAQTRRLIYYSITMLISRGILVVSFFLLLSGIDSLSISSMETAGIWAGVAALFALISVALQVAAGYKIYTVLNNIRNRRYEVIYQTQIIDKYH